MKIMIIAGARPNFMKIAPLIRAINKHNMGLGNGDNKLSFVLVHTGQHYDIKMSEVFFHELQLPKPDVNLETGSASHAVQTADIMTRFEPVCLAENPDWILVVGDVNSTVACTLVAAKLGIKVGHVEAGLRSYDRSMPEEINRVVTDALADLLFIPSMDASENLAREGINDSKIKFVGNIMIDSLLNHLDSANRQETYAKYDLERQNYAVVTLHRPSNTDDDVFLTKIMKILDSISNKLTLLFPVHPRTRKKLKSLGLEKQADEKSKIIFTEPLGYFDFINVVANARLVITDSGGLQEETTYLKIPCLTLRTTTERPITVSIGTNKLTSLDMLDYDINSILCGDFRKGEIPELWDGRTGERIIKQLVMSEYSS